MVRRILLDQRCGGVHATVDFASHWNAHSIRAQIGMPQDRAVPISPLPATRHLQRRSVILPLLVEVGRLADPGLAAALRNRNPVITLLEDERVLSIRNLRGLSRCPLLPARNHAVEDTS
jgi:hypothetical protein